MPHKKKGVDPSSSSVALFESIGVNTHMNYTDLNYGNVPLVLEQLRALGVKHLRDGLHGWPNLDAFSYYNDIYSKPAIQLGCKWNCVVDPSENLGPITSSLLYAFFAGYGSSIESFEGMNEPDLGTPVGWPQTAKNWQQTLFQAAHQMPQVPALLPTWGPALAYATQNADDLGNIASICDAASLHPYPAGKPPEPVIEDQIQYGMIMSGGKPVMVTETGYFTGYDGNPNAAGQPSVSESAAGKYTLRLLLSNFMEGIPRTWLYELQDGGPDNNWGLVRWNGQAKPAFKAVSNLISILGREVAQRVPLDMSMNGEAPMASLMLQNGYASWLLFLWQPVNCYETSKKTSGEIINAEVPVDLEFSEKYALTTYRPFDQRSAVEIGSGTSMTVSVPDHPVAILIS